MPNKVSRYLPMNHVVHYLTFQTFLLSLRRAEEWIFKLIMDNINKCKLCKMKIGYLGVSWVAESDNITSRSFQGHLKVKLQKSR